MATKDWRSLGAAVSRWFRIMIGPHLPISILIRIFTSEDTPKRVVYILRSHLAITQLGVVVNLTMGN